MLPSDKQAIRDELAAWISGLISGNGFGDDYADDETIRWAGELLESPAVRRIQAEAIRQAAIKAQEAYVAEQGGIGYARVRTDWLHEEANRIEKGGATDD